MEANTIVQQQQTVIACSQLGADRRWIQNWTSYFAADIEPEYITISSDLQNASVTLQEKYVVKADLVSENNYKDFSFRAK
jgi:hypothetical protein